MLDHYNVSTRKLDETVHFYETVLGFTNGPRPPFNFPGAWLYSSGHPVLHLNDISQTEKQQRTDSGVIDHVHLSEKGVPYHVNQVPNSARWQIFLRDPNNVEIELNFESKNEAGKSASSSSGRNPDMTADGNWNLVVTTPLGERRGVLSLKTEGKTLSVAKWPTKNSVEIFDGAVDSDVISWKASITDPIPMLEFNGMINGDEVTGGMILGDFGTSTFSGTRS